MAKVRTLSRKFMQGHLLAGCPTLFVESFLNSIKPNWKENDEYWFDLCNYNYKNLDKSKISIKELYSFYDSLRKTNLVKKHTIRGGNHFKAADKISIRCWLDKPYNSPQIILWDDLEVKKVFDFSKDLLSDNFYLNSKELRFNEILTLANNDGLELSEFNQWFNKPFVGQIITWSDGLNY